MPHRLALSLIAAPGSDALSGREIAAAATLFGQPAEAGRWLAPGHAWTLPLDADAAEASRRLDDLREAMAQAPVDVNIATAPLRKRIFVADMDSTIIEQECVDELAAMVGLKDQVSDITERAMRGELAFEPALRERVALLAGLDLSAIDRLLAETITLTPGARAAVQTMRAHGAVTALVSGGFTLFTGPVARRTGFHVNHANRLATKDGTLTGEILPPILGRETKRTLLLALASENRVPPALTLAVGDGANDLGMIQTAGLGVAFRAKPAVAAAAQARIDHGDLTALLFLQGYSADEFVG